MTVFENPVEQSSSLTFVLLFEKKEAICIAGMLVHLCSRQLIKAFFLYHF